MNTQQCYCSYVEFPTLKMYLLRRTFMAQKQAHSSNQEHTTACNSAHWIMLLVGSVALSSIVFSSSVVISSAESPILL